VSKTSPLLFQAMTGRRGVIPDTYTAQGVSQPPFLVEAGGYKFLLGYRFIHTYSTAKYAIGLFLVGATYCCLSTCLSIPG